MRITNLKPLISEEAIQTRVKEMAGEISTLYKDEPLVVVCVLKGAFMFFSDLVRHLTCKPELDFVRLASYGSAAPAFQDDHVHQGRGNPARRQACAHRRGHRGHRAQHGFPVPPVSGARRPEPAACGSGRQERAARGAVTSHFVGFALPSGFVVGYGLDYAESYRELPAIYEAEIEE